MKYVFIIVLAAILVRIDVVIRLVEKGIGVFHRESPASLATEETPGSEIVSVTEDKAINLSAKNRFINMLENFAKSPDETLRLRAMQEFRSKPNMFTNKLDPELEGAIFSWRDLITQNAHELPLFLLDLLGVLTGENKDAVYRFYSLVMDANLKMFLGSYTQSKDTNCTIATLVGDPLPEEEKINELFDREHALNDFVNTEGVDPLQKNLANSCVLVLRLYLAKVAPAPVSDEASPEESTPPAASTSPAPAPTAPEGQSP